MHNDAPTLDGVVYTYESLSEEGQLAAKVGNNTLLSITETGRRHTRGEAVTLRLRPDRIHLFDGETQQAL